MFILPFNLSQKFRVMFQIQPLVNLCGMEVRSGEGGCSNLLFAMRCTCKLKAVSKLDFLNKCLKALSLRRCCTTGVNAFRYENYSKLPQKFKKITCTNLS